MSVRIPLVGNSLRQQNGVSYDSWFEQNLQLSQKNDGPEPATITRDRSLQSKNGNYRNLIKENVFWTYLPWCLKSTIWRKSSMTWKNRHNFSKIWPKQELCYWSMLLLLVFTSTIYESQAIATLSESRLGYNFLVCLVWHPEQNRHAPGKNIYTRFQHQN